MAGIVKKYTGPKPPKGAPLGASGLNSGNMSRGRATPTPAPNIAAPKGVAGATKPKGSMKPTATAPTMPSGGMGGAEGLGNPDYLAAMNFALSQGALPGQITPGEVPYLANGLSGEGLNQLSGAGYGWDPSMGFLLGGAGAQMGGAGQQYHYERDPMTGNSVLVLGAAPPDTRLNDLSSQTGVDPNQLRGIEGYFGVGQRDYANMMEWSVSQGYFPGQITEAELPALANASPSVQLAISQQPYVYMPGIGYVLEGSEIGNQLLGGGGGGGGGVPSYGGGGGGMGSNPQQYNQGQYRWRV